MEHEKHPKANFRFPFLLYFCTPAAIPPVYVKHFIKQKTMKKNKSFESQLRLYEVLQKKK